MIRTAFRTGALRASPFLVGLAALAGGVALVPAPVAAQSAPAPTLVIYGDQKCPTDANGNEVVVCVRRSQSEQFRIPKELREFKVTPENESWAVKAQGVVNDSTVAGGVGSCSTVGAGGQSGCFLKQAEEARRVNKDRRTDQQQLEASLP